jgi:hypothetical protein
MDPSSTCGMTANSPVRGPVAQTQEEVDGQAVLSPQDRGPELLEAVSAMLERGREIYLTGRTT